MGGDDRGPPGHGKAAIAPASKLTRITWAVWHNDIDFQSQPTAIEAT